MPTPLDITRAVLARHPYDDETVILALAGRASEVCDEARSLVNRYICNLMDGEDIASAVACLRDVVRTEEAPDANP